jgi:hypothetical protein
MGEATLDRAGRWHSTAPVLEKYLNVRFGPKLLPPSPAAGVNPFSAQAVEARAVLGGTLSWPEAGGVEGRVY